MLQLSTSPLCSPQAVEVALKNNRNNFSSVPCRKEQNAPSSPEARLEYGFLTFSITSFEQLTATAVVTKLLCGRR